MGAIYYFKRGNNQDIKYFNTYNINVNGAIAPNTICLDPCLPLVVIV